MTYAYYMDIKMLPATEQTNFSHYSKLSIISFLSSIVECRNKNREGVEKL